MTERSLHQAMKILGERRRPSRSTAWAAGMILCGAASLHAQAPPIAPLVATSFGDAGPSQPYIAIQQPNIPGLAKDHFARAYLGDGLLGIRPNPNPLSQSETVAMGFVFQHPQGGFEMASPAPYPLGVDLRVGNSSLLGDAGRLTVHAQTLDMQNAELITEMTFAADNGTTLALKVTQFLARSVPSLLCQQIEIVPSRDAQIDILPRIMHEGIPGTVDRDQPLGDSTQLAQVLGITSDSGSRIGEAILVPPAEELIRQKDGGFSLTVKANETGIFREIAAVVTSAYHPAPGLEAMRVASWGGMLGWDELRAQNRSAWHELWQSRVIVDGDDAAQRALDAAFFYVHSSVHADLLTGVAPFGTSQWSDYAGHAFWDMDSWDLPAVVSADPEAARAMVRYRARGLEAAEHKAASFGLQGAMFPWEAGLDGSEVTPAEAATGWAEQHIVPDVAVGAWEYYAATADQQTLREAVWPIEREVADWIVSRGVFTARGFEIRHVMGANEWVANVDNDSMVNLMSRMALRDAISAARAVGQTPPPLWLRAEKEMYLSVDPVRKVVQPFSQDRPLLYFNEPENRYETVEIGQHPDAYTIGNVQMMVFHNPPIPLSLFRSTWEYEESLRAQRVPTPSVPGSVRSPGFSIPPFAACAALFGDRKKAADLFHLAATEYAIEPFQISKEYRPYTDGAYITNQSSLLLAAIYGFTGLRISDGDWRKYPVSLPEGWKRMEIARIWIHGQPWHLIAEQGKPLQLISAGATGTTAAKPAPHAGSANH
jgi:trehalose/maltose hydrolase-like predicted phosphorylase